MGSPPRIWSQPGLQTVRASCALDPLAAPARVGNLAAELAEHGQAGGAGMLSRSMVGSASRLRVLVKQTQEKMRPEVQISQFEMPVKIPPKL